MSRFFNEAYAPLCAYVPGEQPQDQRYIKLNTNESPYPPSPEVLAAVDRAELADLRLYSDPACAGLVSRLAAFYGVAPENVFPGNGSDEILNFAFMAFGADGAYFPDVTYGFYPVFAALHGVPFQEIPLLADYTINCRDYFGLPGLIVLANPNAPTGVALPVSGIEEIVARNPGRVVLVDEAYVDFGGESCIPLMKRYDNLLVVMTYSKSRCMAGARLGFAVGNEALIADLNRLKYSTNPYNVNRMTLLCGEAALDSDAYYRDRCAKIEKTRAYATRALEALGFSVLPSRANFVFAGNQELDGGKLYLELKRRGILIRHFTKERIRQYNRISIGTEEQMDRLLTEIEAIIKGGFAHADR